MKPSFSIPSGQLFSMWSRCRRTACVTRAGVLLCAFAAGGAYADETAPIVAVAKVTREDLARDLSIQAEFRPYQEIDLHAKVAGYLQDIRVDIGDRVKAGDLIATLEVPELKDDLTRAAAAVQRAEVEYKEAHLNYTRLSDVSRGQPNLVAQQDIDVAEGRDGSAAAELAEARADLEKYRTLEDYSRINAPFGGVITKRYTDPGALIQAGTASNTQAMPLVRLSQNDRLRLDFPVSVSYASDIEVGDPVDIELTDDGRHLAGVIARFSRRITTETRTMNTEVEVPNPDLKLIPGSYVTVALKVDRRPHTLAVPVEAVAGTQNPTVVVVNRENRIEERAVRLGIETPAKYEILSGLVEGEQVMIGNRSSVRAGQTVDPKPVELTSVP